MIYKPGDLILVHGDHFLDRAIEDITHSQFSHVAGFDAKGSLIEAQSFRKIGYQDPGVYAGHADLYTCDGLTDTQRTIILDYVRREIGKPYDYVLIAIETCRYLLHVSLPFKEPFQSRICSTLWSDAYMAAGINLCPGITFPSPGDLAMSKRLRKVGAFTT